MQRLKESLANAIAGSALVGDHDVNPGNMLVITKDNLSRVVRIDFGHAFNDLLNVAKENGGRLRDINNPVLDFLNRDQVAGVLGAPSKLRRDYPGIILSQELVNALKTLGQDYEKKVNIGADKAKKEFCVLIDTMRVEMDYQGIEHIMNSLDAIYKNITGEKMEVEEGSSLSQSNAILDKLFVAYGNFVKTNCENAALVANVLQLQVDIDNALKNGKPLLATFFEIVRDKNIPMRDGKILWVKTGTTPPFSGCLDNYIAHRANELSKDQSLKIEETVKNFRMLREQVLSEKTSKTPIGDSFYAKTSSSTFFSKVESKTLDQGAFLSALQDYIDKRLPKADKGMFGLYTKEDKINAVNALIAALLGFKDENFQAQYPILKDGELGEIISSFARVTTGSKQQKVDALLDDIENANIWRSTGEVLRYRT